ncbi:MAG TPA: cytochrome c biogenesis protein CcsA [Anaeromyxobacteraceae bacterium]|jgi:cytochrome c-type biogenesis protein CcsB|nr:cytochrome c biogenesis protein CcsA [Anaeromyxobacteraceae bacterium]
MSRFAVEVALHWGAVAFYMLAAVIFANAVIFRHPGRSRWAHRALALGLIPHAAAIGLRWVSVGHGPYMLRYEVLSSNAWIALAFLALFLRRRPNWEVLALLVLPVCILAIAVGLFSSGEMRHLPPTLRSIWLVFHVVFAKLAAASFLLSVASSVILLLGIRPLPGTWTERLPESQDLDAYTVRFIAFGFLFWTVTIAAGSIWANQSWGRYWGWDVLETWSLIAWLVYGSFLHARLFFRMQARPTAWSAVVCFFLFITTVLVLPYFLPSLHSAYFQ